MPIRFTGNAGSYPDDAFFPTLQSLDQVIAGLPGFRGAWDAADYSGSGAWVPRIAPASGRYQLTPAASGTPPTRADRNGRAVLRITPSGRVWVQDAAGAAQPFTGLAYASRAYFSNTTTNFQKVFDFGTPEFFFRSSLANPIWQMAGLGVQGTTPIRTPIVGWHSFLLRKPSGNAGFCLNNDGSEVSFGSEAALSGTMMLGDATGSTSAEQDISRVIICDSGEITMTQRAAMMTWING